MKAYFVSYHIYFRSIQYIIQYNVVHIWINVCFKRQITRFAQLYDYNNYSRYDSVALNMAEEGGVSVNKVLDLEGVKKDKVDIYRDTPIRYLGNGC